MDDLTGRHHSLSPDVQNKSRATCPTVCSSLKCVPLALCYNKLIAFLMAFVDVHQVEENRAGNTSVGEDCHSAGYQNQTALTIRTEQKEMQMACYRYYPRQ